MHPNILFISIDNIRADKFDKSSSINAPNLFNLISNGAFFEQAISASDGTIISLSNVFTGNYSTKTGVKTYFFKKNIPTFFDDLKNYGYKTLCCFPDIKFLKQIGSNFDEQIIYSYVDRDSYQTLFDGLGDRIIEKLESNQKEPWIFFLHLMDAKPPVKIPKEFDNIEYGKTTSDRVISSIDHWIGKFLNKIDASKTIVIISSDHGNFVPFDEKGLNYIPNHIKNLLRKMKRFTILEKNGKILYLILRRFFKLSNNIKIRNFDAIKQRSYQIRTKTELFDELIRIPLIMSGFGIRPNRIADLVRQVDIFPTVFNIAGLRLEKNCNGRSLLPLLNGEKIEEIPAFIENAVLLENDQESSKEGTFIGLRTSSWKYQRSRFDKNPKISLYDLKNDPYELDNVALTYPDKILKMEIELQKILHDSSEKDEIRNILKNKKF